MGLAVIQGGHLNTIVDDMEDNSETNISTNKTRQVMILHYTYSSGLQIPTDSLSYQLNTNIHN
jgi:hypothetical protein